MISHDSIDVPIRSARVESSDGTSIAYYVAGVGPRVWVIPPGLGTPLTAWKRVLEHFADQLTMITWNQRGSFASALPRGRTCLGVPDNVRDLEAIVASEGVQRFALGGWSLAVQIALEYYARHPQYVTRLLLLNGAYEHVLRTAFLPGMDRALTPLVGLLARFGDRLAPVLERTLAAAPYLLPRLGLIADDTPLIRQVIRDFGTQTWSVYFAMMLAANAHSAKAHLDTVRVPTLITAGDADRMTPLSTAREMHRRIAGSQLVILPGGTHFSTIEFPELLNEVLERFFDDWPADDADAS